MLKSTVLITALLFSFNSTQAQDPKAGNAVMASVGALVDSGKLNTDDEAAVTQMIAINDLLGKTSQGIIAFIKDPSDENQATYDKNRQKAWKSISKFLGLEE